MNPEMCDACRTAFGIFRLKNERGYRTFCERCFPLRGEALPTPQTIAQELARAHLHLAAAHSRLAEVLLDAGTASVPGQISLASRLVNEMLAEVEARSRGGFVDSLRDYQKRLASDDKEAARHAALLIIRVAHDERVERLRRLERHIEMLSNQHRTATFLAYGSFLNSRDCATAVASGDRSSHEQPRRSHAGG